MNENNNFIDKNPDRISGKVSPTDKIEINKLIKEGVAGTFAEAISIIVEAYKNQPAEQKSLSIDKDLNELKTYFSGISTVMTNICNKANAHGLASDNKIAELETEYNAKLEEVKSAYELKIEELNEKISSLTEDNYIIHYNLSEKENEIEELKVEISELNKALVSKTAENDKLSAECSKLTSEVENYLYELKSARHKVELYEETREKLNEVEHSLSDSQIKNKELLSKIDIKKSEVDELIKSLEVTTSKLDKSVEDKSAADSKIAYLEGAMANLEEVNKSLTESVSEYKAEYKSLNKEVLELSKNVQSKEFEIEKLKSQLTLLKKEK